MPHNACKQPPITDILQNIQCLACVVIAHVFELQFRCQCGDVLQGNAVNWCGEIVSANHNAIMVIGKSAGDKSIVFAVLDQQRIVN